jgi:sugar phosphate isomerase/epimerase
MLIRLACADFTFPLLPHEKVLDLIALLGFDGVDIGLFEGRSHLQPSDQFVRVGRAARRLGRSLAGRNLAAADVFLQTAPDFATYAVNHPQASRRRMARDWFLRTLDYAAGCGAGHVSALPGVYFEGHAKAACWARSCDELAWRVEQARRLGIVFGVEAHAGSIAPHPRQAARLAGCVPGLTLTLDYTHFTRRGLPDSAVEPLLPWASHFHVRGARRGRLQASFAENTIDYGRVLRGMRQVAYRGFIGVEYVWTEWERCNQVDNLSETILFRDFLRKTAANL